MADILPLVNLLPEIMEGDTASVTFTPELDPATEVFVSCEIIETNFPDTIDIQGPTFSGKFEHLFKLPPESLKYRIGLDYGVADSFADLPPKGTAQLYEYHAPREMLKNFNVKVQLNYTDLAGTPLNITKDYIQPIQGNWDNFRRQFLDYVR